MRTAQPPQSRSRSSHYWPDYQTWRKFTGPEQEAEKEKEVVTLSSDTEKAKTTDSDSEVKII